jgi:hypothetical protein
MKYLLSQACLSFAARLTQERTLCAFGFNGTLSPMADQAAVRIGRKLRSHARYYLRNQSGIDERLELPARLRAPIAPA